jgi:hypothetical protein
VATGALRLAVRPDVSPKLENRAVTKFENRCANCGGKFGLVCYHHWGMRFCRKSCKDAFLVKAANDYARGAEKNASMDAPKLKANS